MGTSAFTDASPLRRQIILIMLVRALAMSMGFAIPFFVDFWERRFQLTMTEILLVEALFQGVWLVFDIPFGYLADIWGRRRALVLGAALLAVGAGIYLFNRQLWGLIVAEIFVAVGMASVSGSDQAILRHSLRVHGRENQFDRVWSYAQAVDVVYLTVSAIAGGFLYAVNEVLPFAAVVAGFVTLGVVSMMLREEPRIDRDAGVRHLHEIGRLTVESLRNARLRWVFLMNGFVFAQLNATMWLTAKYLSTSGISVGFNGWIFAGLGLLCALFITRIAERPNGINRRSFALRSALVPAICFFGLGFSACWPGVLLFCALQWTRAELRVRTPGWIRLEVRHDEHATGSSVNGAVYRVMFIGLAVFIHLVGRTWSVEQIFQLLSVISVVGGFVLWWTCPEESRREIPADETSLAKFDVADR